jgi:lipopolysaccharide export system protein LptA
MKPMLNVEDQVHVKGRLIRKNGDYWLVRLNSATGYDTEIMLHRGELIELSKSVYLGPTWNDGTQVEYKMFDGRAVLTQSHYLVAYTQEQVQRVAVELLDNLDVPVCWNFKNIVVEVRKP